MNYRIGYIGFGGMAGGYHYDTAMREDIPFTPTAVYDINPEVRKNAAERGLTVFDNVDDFLKSRLFDFVLVATPNQYHMPYAKKALEAGYNVMSEKPVAMNCAELEETIATAKRVGKLFTVHQNRRWDRDYLIVKEALGKNMIGKPLVIESRLHCKEGNGQMFGWRAYADHGGGMFGDWGIHELDQVLDLIREPVKSVYATIFRMHSVDVDDYAKLMITFESGLTASVEVNTFAPIVLPKWYIIGETGALTVQDTCGERGLVHRIKESHTAPVDAQVYPDYHMETRHYDQVVIDSWEDVTVPEQPLPQDWGALYKNLAGVLDGTEELAVTPESVLRCFRVMEAARLSAETGRSVEL